MKTGRKRAIWRAFHALRQPLDADIAVHHGAFRIVGLEGERTFANAATRITLGDFGE
jgi:hypothetical protein